MCDNCEWHAGIAQKYLTPAVYVALAQAPSVSRGVDEDRQAPLWGEVGQLLQPARLTHQDYQRCVQALTARMLNFVNSIWQSTDTDIVEPCLGRVTLEQQSAATLLHSNDHIYDRQADNDVVSELVVLLSS
eukprot:CAMPEP_0181506566 /NCGR_PEP_ID=MMETSP1110-20121109/58663_1 /TAXON_ID=174948 /ORGANISM="Symbiodinium sp., Strain CCMP421" /LENGTH=130 /DNA_ID=CAMNT_0023635633 /DNA_START=43 /DNA_END=434 /DNA_ORIENTATION=+